MRKRAARSRIPARVVMLVALIGGVATACRSAPDGSAPSGEVPPVTVAATTSPSTSRSSPASTTGAVDTVITVLSGPGPDLHERLSQLGSYGYGVRPIGPEQAFYEVVPDIGIDEPTIEVRAFGVNWGIDSFGTLLVAAGPSEAIDRVALEAADLVAERPRLGGVAGGDTWLAVFLGSHGGRDETDRLMAAIDAIMDPDTACVSTPEACPGGIEAGFPAPPPALVANTDAVAPAALPFTVVALGAEASALYSDGSQLLWSQDGEIVATLEPIEPARTDYLSGTGLFGLAIGATQIVVDPGREGIGGEVRANRCCSEPEAAGPVSSWEIPEHWAVEGLAFTGVFGFDNYALVFTGTRLDQGRPLPLVVQVPVDSRFLAGEYRGFDLSAAMAAAEPIEVDGVWSVPHWHNGQLAVVQERAEGWYLVLDALGEPRDLVRSNRPIISYTLDRGAINVALAVGDSSRAAVWWVHRDDVTALDIEATSVVWYGSHRVDSWGAD